MHTAIVVDQEYRDTTADLFVDILAKGGTSEVVTVADFLRNMGVRFDEDLAYLVLDEAEIGERFRDASELTVCNRVVKVSTKTASSLDGNRKLLTPSFVLSAYARVLARLPRVWGRIDRYPAPQQLPLNLQWRAFAKRIQDVGTPRFAYAFGAEPPDVSSFREPLWKSPFDVDTWRPVPEFVRPQLHAFVVDKPLGEPVVAYFVGGAEDAFRLRSQADLDESVAAKLSKSVAAIKDAFAAFMGEALFFVDGTEVIFAGFSQYLKTSAGHERFVSVAERGFV